MSASSGPSENDCQANDVAIVDEKERNKDAENIKKFKDLLTQIESEFLAIMKDLMKKCGEPLTNCLKVLISIIDEVVKMLVDTTFTAKEKQERSKEIKELSSTFSPTPLRFHTSISENQQGETVLQEMHPDDSLLGRGTCAMMAQSLFREIWAKFQFDFNDDEDSIPEILLRRHLEMFISDWESLSLVYDSVSESALNASLCE